MTVIRMGRAANEKSDLSKFAAKTLPPLPKLEKIPHVAVPCTFIEAVTAKTKGRVALLVALYVYRVSYIAQKQGRNLTVTLGDKFDDLDIPQQTVYDALEMLQTKGIIQFDRRRGAKARIVLLWREERSRADR